MVEAKPAVDGCRPHQSTRLSGLLSNRKRGIWCAAFLAPDVTMCNGTGTPLDRPAVAFNNNPARLLPAHRWPTPAPTDRLQGSSCGPAATSTTTAWRRTCGPAWPSPTTPLFRQEATAQAHAVRFLQGGLFAYAASSPLKLDALVDRVQWETGPGPGTDALPDPPEPADNCDPTKLSAEAGMPSLQGG